MTTHVRPRRLTALAGAALLLLAGPAIAQNGEAWSPDSYRSGGSSANAGSSGGYSSDRGYGYGSGGGSGDSYAPRREAYGGGAGSYSPSPPSRNGYGAGGDAYSPNRDGGYGGGSGDAYSPSRGGYGANDAYSPSRDGYGGSGDAYSPRQGRSDSYSDPGRPVDDGGRGGYGEPYAPPPGEEAYRDGGPPRDSNRYYEQSEIVAAGHGFFGAISQGLGKAVESIFASQGRPNGYILGEDAGGAFLVGLRYGEGTLYTKDAGDHKVFWQGPSVGYDAGAEGSKAMVLVYNLSDPSDIYNRFGGVQGSAYVVGGLSVQFQKYGDVTLAIIRSGVGLRLGANVGYIKYTRAPTWNPL